MHLLAAALLTAQTTAPWVPSFTVSPNAPLLTLAPVIYETLQNQKQRNDQQEQRLEATRAALESSPYCGHRPSNHLSETPVTVRIDSAGNVFASVPQTQTDHTAASTLKTLTMFRVFNDVLGGKIENLGKPVPEEVIKSANALGSRFFQDGKPHTWGEFMKHIWEKSHNGLAEIIGAYRPDQPLPKSFPALAAQAGDNLQLFLLNHTTIDLSKVIALNGSGHPDGVEGGSGVYPAARTSSLCLQTTPSVLPSRQKRVDIKEYTKALWELANTTKGTQFVQWLEAHDVKSRDTLPGVNKTGTDNTTTGFVAFKLHSFQGQDSVAVTVQLGQGNYTPSPTPYKIGFVERNTPPIPNILATLPLPQTTDVSPLAQIETSPINTDGVFNTAEAFQGLSNLPTGYLNLFGFSVEK
jgi:hypothetical protein